MSETLKTERISLTDNAGPRVVIKDLALVTIVSKNYLAYARTLAKSFLKYHEAPVWVLLTDRLEGRLDLSQEPFELVELETIKERIPNFVQFCFQYNPTELNTAVKPFFLEYLFEVQGFNKVLFLDPDIWVCQPLDTVLFLLDQHSVILTPHITRPFDDLKKPSELEILRSGTYNLGFLALSKSPATGLLLAWWKERLARFCKIDQDRGFFVDQKWLELVPGFFDGVYVLKDPACNVAYWNLHYRRLSWQGQTLLVNQKPLHFMHFSGMRPDDAHMLSVHQDRFSLRDDPALQKTFEIYRNLLFANGHREISSWPCVYNFFSNGVKIPDTARRLYWELPEEKKEVFGNPFEVGPKSFFAWLNEKLDARHPPISRLMRGVWEEDAELRAFHPDYLGTDREAFYHWFCLNAFARLGVDKHFLGALLPAAPKSYSFWIAFKLKVLYRLRHLLKALVKRLVKNNLSVINRLKILEKRLFQWCVRFGKQGSVKERSRRPVMLKSGVNLLGYLQAELGVGEGARSTARSLQAVNCPLVLLNNTTHSFSRQEDKSFEHFSPVNPYGVNLIHVNADMFQRLHEELGSAFFKDRYTIGYWAWELSEFPDEWVPSFEYCHEVWVPSRFVQDALAVKATCPVLRFPHAVSLSVFDQAFCLGDLGVASDKFTFLFVFDFLSYFERKNPLGVIEAFKKAFLPSEKAQLIIKCSNAENNLAGFQQLQKAAQGYPILILDQYLSRPSLNSLMNSSDAYVSLHRSEGFGLTIAEAMSLGKPVIATNYSGNTDFMTSENSFPVKYTLEQIGVPIGPYSADARWAAPDLDEAGYLMRRVYQNQEEASTRGARARQDIQENLSFAKIGQGMKARIDRICSR